MRADSNARFESTSLSRILRARDLSHPRHADDLNTLFCIYWPPIYAFIRKHDFEREDAKDITQSFVTHVFLERGTLDRYDPARAKFRSFLMKYLDNYLRNERYKAAAAERIGHAPIVSIDAEEADRVYVEPANTLTPDLAAKRAWAHAIIQTALKDLKKDFARTGKEKHFEIVELHALQSPKCPSYAEIGEMLKLSMTDVDNFLRRSMARLRTHIEHRLRQGISSDAELQDERRDLFEHLK